MSQRLSGNRAHVRASLSHKRNSCTVCHACMSNESTHQQRWSYWHPHICRACCVCASHAELRVCVKRSFVPQEQSLKYSYASTTSAGSVGAAHTWSSARGSRSLPKREDRPSVAIYCLWVHWSGGEMLVDSPSRGLSEFAAPSRIMYQLLTGERRTGNNYYCNKYTWNEGEHPSFNYGRCAGYTGLFYIFDSLKWLQLFLWKRISASIMLIKLDLYSRNINRL